MNALALAEFEDVFQILLFFILFVFQLYLLVKLFSYIDSAIFSRYKFLGPFALLIAGVLRPGGARVFSAFLMVTAALLGLGLYLFEFEGLVSTHTP